MKKSLFYMVATGFGSGYAPIAPGTAGSLLALVFYLIIPLTPWWWLVIVIIMTFIGIISSTYVERYTKKDPGIVVIDEMAGQWLSLLFLPRSLQIFIAAFFIFRILDIIKPFPADRSQKLQGGLGIMLDDLIAGIYTNIIIRIGLWGFTNTMF
jgi:phosphatidylglycerophosphatase A